LEQISFTSLPERITPDPRVPSNPPSRWAADVVERAHALQLVPVGLEMDYTQAISRAEFAALGVRLYEHLNAPVTGRTTFMDTTDVYVQKAAYIGIVSGVGNNRFNPGATITREQAAVILSRLLTLLDVPQPQVPLTFADNALFSPRAMPLVSGIVHAGIMGSVGDNRFAPAGDFTREQAIVTVMRVLNAARPAVWVEIYIPDSPFAAALELIYETPFNRYYLSAIMSNAIELTFPDGTVRILNEAMDEGLITVYDLIYSGLRVWVMPQLVTVTAQ